MAAAANKPGAVHYTLVVFVVLTVILGITNYMSFRDASDKFVEYLKVVDENQKLNKASRTLDDQIQALKNQIGIKLDLVDDPTNPNNQATVIAALKNEIATYGKDLAGNNVQETIRKLRDGVDAAAADRDSKTTKVGVLEKELLALKGQYQNQVDNYRGKSETYNREKQDVIGSEKEKIDAKIQEITRLNSEVKDFQIRLEEEKDSREKERTTLTNDVAALETRINFLRDKIDNLEKLSFEVADGVVTRVEHSNSTVLLNLGEEDFLKTRMTFSVYARDNQGVGRGPEDIKGKIEVTRILGPHISEARIVDEDLYRPIMAQDLIYTPIWSPGLVEKISIIGDIDLDNDGRSDREQFHQMLAVAGCIIDNEVDDNGDRVPVDGKVTVQTRFLVKADVPDLADALTDDEKEKSKKVNLQYKNMEDEARKNGVRVIKLNDFLAYIGFHSKRRTFLPGQDRPFALKSGSTSVAGSGDPMDTSSNGAVSGAFRKGRQAKQDVSNGATSKSFGGGDGQ